MNPRCIIVFILAILLSGCVTSYNTTETVEPKIEAYEIEWIDQVDPPISTPTPELDPIRILSNDIIKNDVANKSHYSVIGGSKDVHICGNMACEQAEWIAENYGYDVGIVILWSKHGSVGHAQTWVVIGDERYIIESTSNGYWSESEHKDEFGEFYKIHFVSIQKGREHTKASAEYCRTG